REPNEGHSLRPEHAMKTLVPFALLFVSTAALAQQDLRPGPEPPDAPASMKELIGDYGYRADTSPFIVFENEGKLFVTKKGYDPHPWTHPLLEGIAGSPHRDYAATTGPYAVQPPRPVEELRRDALKATPPVEAGAFRKPDLVDIAQLNPAIH